MVAKIPYIVNHTFYQAQHAGNGGLQFMGGHADKVCLLLAPGLCLLVFPLELVHIGQKMLVEGIDIRG